MIDPIKVAHVITTGTICGSFAFLTPIFTDVSPWMGAIGGLICLIAGFSTIGAILLPAFEAELPHVDEDAVCMFEPIPPFLLTDDMRAA